MMNTLANHGFIPRDGRNLTLANVVKGLGDGLNFDPALASVMFGAAIIANPEPNATFFTLYVYQYYFSVSHSLFRSAPYLQRLGVSKRTKNGVRYQTHS